MDSRFYAMDSGLQVLDSGFLISEIQSSVGFQIPIISRIPDSLSWIPESRYLFPGDKMATDLHLRNGGVPIHASDVGFLALLSGIRL